MGNVAKVLCFREPDSEKEPPLKGKAKDKAGNFIVYEERKKLKAVSCLTPSRGSFDNDICQSKSFSKKPCIHDYVLYSVRPFLIRFLVLGDLVKSSLQNIERMISFLPSRPFLNHNYNCDIPTSIRF